MDDFKVEDFEFNINPDAPLFVISVVSDMVRIPIWTLRRLDEMGVVSAERQGKKTRCYSKHQIKKLIYIRYLMEDKGVNISGIKFILTNEQHRKGADND
ncbi:MAG: MerR family transcriptional regulator [Candidatus Omnitrophica bacterium]|nr:MerR family transcriptional regulator [Candidatus Omnitrophota bacterium]